jgi:hypothetical protein
VKLFDHQKNALCEKKGGEPRYEGGNWTLAVGTFFPEQIIPSKCKKNRENREERKLNW